ncbi:CLUMA_CG016898, isoform A [Clunio marinus]|uniref:CLUMA_CG016898, isoform A n=1 Tax=Clunio marinus TaxID=568069 RepID=A0A1J1IUY7_9DIPT|nr:CLUMA_CG016898, isoform A [Clunio marinus]
MFYEKARTFSSEPEESEKANGMGRHGQEKEEMKRKEEASVLFTNIYPTAQHCFAVSDKISSLYVSKTDNEAEKA